MGTRQSLLHLMEQTKPPSDRCHKIILLENYQSSQFTSNHPSAPSHTMTLASQSTLHNQLPQNIAMHRTKKYSSKAPKTPGKNKRPSPNKLEKEENRTPKPPTVSLVRTDQGKAARDNIEADNKVSDVEMEAKAAEVYDTMYEDATTEENEATDASIAAGEEEAQKRRDQAAETEAMAKRMRDFSASGGRRNDEVIQEDEDDGSSDNDVANSVWAKPSLPTETNQRKKKQTTLAQSISTSAYYSLR